MNDDELRDRLKAHSITIYNYVGHVGIDLNRSERFLYNYSPELSQRDNANLAGGTPLLFLSFLLFME